MAQLCLRCRVVAQILRALALGCPRHRMGPTSRPCLLRRHLGRRWAATGPPSSTIYCVLTIQVNGMPAFRHQLVPGTQLRFDGEWKVRHTPPPPSCH